MLSNFQLGTHALLQSFLVGQPEFRLILQSPQMHQLRQRVIAACHIGPLDAKDTRRYVEHRLRQVGWADVPRIAPKAFAAIFAASGGVPRRINLLCDRVLLSCFLAGRKTVSANAVNEVAAEIRGEIHLPETAEGLGTGSTPGDDAPAPPVPRPDDTARGSEEAELEELKATLRRLESGNRETQGLFRRLLEWATSGEGRTRGPG